MDTYNPLPELETTRLILREITLEDADALFEIRSNKEVNKYMDRAPHKEMEETEKLILDIKEGTKKREAATWAITLKTNPKLIGTIGFWRMQKEHFRAEIGYLMSPKEQGKGLMQEAMDIIIDFGFNKMNLHSIEAQVNPSNFSSIHILEKKGFKREGYFKENYFFDGNFLDTAVYSLLTENTMKNQG